MKLNSLFRNFLNDIVNLNDNRIELLEKSVDTLQDFLRASDIGKHVVGFEEQGSWAHDTIIRPVDGGEFDADLLVMMNPVEGWSAADYVGAIYNVFMKHGTYKDKCKIWDYCVTITYAGDRKIDLAPCVVGRAYEGQHEVCNRKIDCFERSEPILYTQWLKDANTYSGSNSFRKVTRIFKYVRDIKTRFTCSSVLLTTLLGMQIQWYDAGNAEFSDTPTTLKTLFGRLDDWLQQRPNKPHVDHPVIPYGENFAAGIDEVQYANFRNFVHKYRGWIDEAYDCNSKPESIKLWRKVLGDEFAAGESVLVVKAMAEDASPVRGLLEASAAHFDGLVDLVKQLGPAILPTSFRRPPHMRAPRWRRAHHVTDKVGISATWHPNREARHNARPVLPGEALPARGGIWFMATVNGGQPIPNGYDVEWRITNTGTAAILKRAGRGDFYVSNLRHERYESLEYRGVHMAEAFIIRRTDETLVGQSAPFFVVIE